MLASDAMVERNEYSMVIHVFPQMPAQERYVPESTNHTSQRSRVEIHGFTPCSLLEDGSDPGCEPWRGKFPCL